MNMEILSCVIVYVETREKLTQNDAIHEISFFLLLLYNCYCIYCYVLCTTFNSVSASGLLVKNIYYVLCYLQGLFRAIDVQHCRGLILNHTPFIWELLILPHSKAAAVQVAIEYYSTYTNPGERSFEAFNLSE